MEDAGSARIVLSSLSPDGESGDPRSEVKVTEKKGDLVVEIRSNDISSLRASLNTLLRSCDVAVESLKASKGSERK